MNHNPEINNKDNKTIVNYSDVSNRSVARETVNLNATTFESLWFLPESQIYERKSSSQ